MSRKKLFLFAVLVFLLCSAESCVDDGSSSSSNPFGVQDSSGEWVAQPTASPVERASDAVSKAVYNTPTEKQLLDQCGAGNSAEYLRSFADLCSKRGGSVAQKDIATLGCYK